MVQIKQVAEADKESIHGADLEFIILHEALVYTTADDGKVKIWNKDLVLQKEFQAHDYAVYHLLIVKDKLFTASIDATIKVWNLKTLALEKTLTNHTEPVKRVATNGKRLFSGDDRGDVLVWNLETLECVNKYEVHEEIWDLAVTGNFFLSVRDRGLNIIEVKEGEKNQYTVVRVLQGRAPIYLSEKFIVFGEFGTGYGLQIHKFQPAEFPKITDLKGHSMIITCIGGNVTGGGERLASGGYDQKINLWDLCSGELLSSCPVSVVPSALAMGTDGTVYVGGPDGFLAKMATA